MGKGGRPLRTSVVEFEEHRKWKKKNVAGRGAGELADVDRSHEYVNVAMGGFEES